MAFYRPHVAQVTSWQFAASPGESPNRSVNIPPIATTQAVLFAALTGVSNDSMFLAGGRYHSSDGTLLSGSMEMDTSGMAGSFQRYAHCGLVGDASNVAPGTSLSPYLADGIRYDLTLDPGTDPMSTYVSAVLTIVVLDGPLTYTPSTRAAATVTSAHYAYTSGAGTSTGSVNVWLDAFYRTNVHLLSAWGAAAAGLPFGNWWQAGDAFQPPVHGLPSVYQSVAVAANSPAATSATASPVTYTLTPSEQWAIMAYESDLLPAVYTPPAAAAGVNQVSIVG